MVMCGDCHEFKLASAIKQFVDPARTQFGRRGSRREEALIGENAPLTIERIGAVAEYYIQLTEIEEAIRSLKGDQAIRPVYHRNESRIEVHIFIAIFSYSLHVTLRQRCKHMLPD